MTISGNYCNDQFWDLDQTWSNQIPDFSKCFQDSVFITLPSIIFIFFFFTSIWRLRKRSSLNVLPWTWLNIAKLVLSLSLLFISIIWLSIIIYKQVSNESSIPYSSILSLSSLIVLFILNIFIMLRHRTCGVTTSYLLSVFWLVFTLCGIALHRSAVLTYYTPNTEESESSEAIFILKMIFYPFVYCQLLLTIFPDKRKLESLQDNRVVKDVSFFSYLTFLWFTRYVYKSRQKMLTAFDLGFISVRLVAKRAYSDFVKRWQINDFPSRLKSRSLAVNLIISFWPWVIFAFFLNSLFIACTLLPPLILDRLIDFANNDHFTWRGMFYVSVLFIEDIFGKLMSNLAIFFFFCCGSQIKSSLMNAVYRKNLLLSTAARREYSSGAISSLLSVDIQRLAYFSWHCSELLISPIRIVTIIVIMWQYIGISTLSGVAVMVFFIPISFFISRYSQKFIEKQMNVKDIRLKYMNETLSGMKILKMYAWEVAFSNKITETRRQEMKYVLYAELCSVVTTFVYFCIPFMVSVASFATFLLIDRNHILDPTRAFVTLTLMDQLKFAVFNLPDSIAELIQCNTSLGRLKNFFAADNMDSTVVGNNPMKGEVLTVKRACMSWASEGDCTLNDINLHISKGKLVAIIGPVGCGKSSLMSAILGEMNLMSGSVDIKGSLAYVPQEAWILNRTVKANILMMKNMVDEKYNKILDLCCLRPDLEIMPSGDMTEIGEKGVNLSGGQKQRVSLARAVYQNKDIYLLDDTLSAVDAHVRRALFDDVIGNDGLLKKKTRILVTHDLSVLHKMDIIISMKDGRIDEVGTYQELMQKNGSFTSFIQEHTSQKSLEENSKENTKVLSRYISTDSAASMTSEEDFKEDFKKRKLSLKADDADKVYRLTEDEKMEVGKVKRRIYWNYIKKLKLHLSTLTFLGFAFYVVFETYGNLWLTQWASDPTINGTQDTSLTRWRLEVYGALGFAQALFILVGTTALVYATTTAAREYHCEMLDSLIKSPMSFFDSTPMGRITNRFTSDLDVLDAQLSGLIDGVLNCSFYAIASFYIIGKNAPIFLATLLPVGVIYYILRRLHIYTYRQIKRLESTTKSPLYSQLLESIQGVSSICAYKVQDDFIESFEQKIDNHMVCYLGSITCNRWMNGMLDWVGSTILLISAFLAVQNRHTITPAEVGLMITYTLNVTDALKWFVRMSVEMEDKSISIERVDEYCELQPEAPWNQPLDDNLNNWPKTGQIEFKNYSTKYREELDLVLKEINLSINNGERVGIIGRTGAGKSSITMALFRIIEPTCGTIAIDGVDIKQIGLHKLRSKLTIIPQDPVLFTGSLRSNLDPNNEYSDEELWISLERSHLKSFVSGLEQGLQHNIEESGSNLSAGQKQLVCLARALLKNTNILVLDEATASVDMETDNLIQNTIRTAFSRSTVLTIAHRLKTILDYDKIVVMENGTVFEVGNPSSLLQDTESRFHHMCKDAGLT